VRRIFFSYTFAYIRVLNFPRIHDPLFVLSRIQLLLCSGYQRTFRLKSVSCFIIIWEHLHWAIIAAIKNITQRESCSMTNDDSRCVIFFIAAIIAHYATPITGLFRHFSQYWKLERFFTCSSRIFLYGVCRFINEIGPPNYSRVENWKQRS
jgi:hypothetical protein